MNKEQILEAFQDLLEREFEIDRAQVTPEALLYDDLEIDSIDAVDLIAWMVKVTGKRMNPEVFMKVRTVGDVIDEIEKQLALGA